MSKISLCILFGGNSSEHDVSCVSASSGILGNINKEKYDIHLIGITKDGQWYLYEGDSSLMPKDKWLESGKIRKAHISPDSSSHAIICDDGETIPIDVVFPVLHGKNGEDGTIQGLFQLAKIPFVGCDSTSSGASMDKCITNAIADAYSIPQAKWVGTTKYDFETNQEKVVKKCEEKFGYPCFVKPANAGSSVGVSKATNTEELISGLKEAFVHDKRVVIEEGIVGHEVECAVMGNNEPIAATVGEVIAADDFYTFDAKYNNEDSITQIPANLSQEKIDEVRALAIKTYKALGCEGLSRCDFFVRTSDDAVLFNEINTIPGQTPISMYPKLFEASGIKYPELIDKLIEYALERGGEF